MHVSFTALICVFAHNCIVWSLVPSSAEMIRRNIVGAFILKWCYFCCHCLNRVPWLMLSCWQDTIKELPANRSVDGGNDGFLQLVSRLPQLPDASYLQVLQAHTSAHHGNLYSRSYILIETSWCLTLHHCTRLKMLELVNCLCVQERNTRWSISRRVCVWALAWYSSLWPTAASRPSLTCLVRHHHKNTCDCSVYCCILHWFCSRVHLH